MHLSQYLAALAVAFGMSATGVACAQGTSKPPTSQIHALIMAIGEYDKPFELEGVSRDVDTARDIARRMGVKDGNMQVLRDRQLTLAGMRRAFDELEGRLLDNDQVFIYYSGHGGRQIVKEASGEERCAESLITIDGQAFTDAELEARLKRMSGKAQKSVMFIDACHSGGVTTRSAGSKGEFKAKSWNGNSESCTKPVNVLTRSLESGSKVAGSGAGNFAYIAAARDNEVSLDQPGKGGVASQAWGECMAGAAKDIDGSGALSVEEIRVCAQEKINQRLRNFKDYKPHNVTVTGNSSLVLNYATKESVPVSSQPTSSQGVTATTEPSAAAAARPSPLAALNDIYNNRDDRRMVTVKTGRPTLRIGQDNVDFTVTSREAGYLYVLMVGSDGETFDLLFPNQIDRNNLVKAGETLQLPRPGWQLTVQGPAGKDTLLAIVTDAPRDFSKAGLKPAGPFSVVEAIAAKDIQLVTANSPRADKDECGNERQTRNVAVQKSCSSAYGAGLLTIEEVAR